MIKRIISISLALVMVLAMAVIPASATGTQCVIDNFETGSVGSVSTTTGDGYYASSESSGLFADPSSAVTSNGMSLVSGMGYGDSTGLVMEVGPAGGNAFITTKSIPMTYGEGTTNTVILSYKLKFLSLPTASSDKWAYIGHDYKRSTYYNVGYSPVTATTDNILINNKASSTSATPETGVWYTVVSKYYQKSATSRAATVTIFDEQNNQVLTAPISATLSSTMAVTPVYINGASITEGTAKIVVDDFVLYDYIAKTQAPSLDSANTALKEGATSVAASKAHTLIFDQSVVANNTTVKIYKKADSTKTPVSAQVSGFENSVTIAPEAALDTNTEYVLDFSGVKNSANVALADASAKTISFTTSNLVSPPILKVTSIEDGAVDVDSETKSVTVTFDQPIDTTLSTVMLTYGTNGAIPASISATETENVYVVSWTDDLGSRIKYTVDLSGVKNSVNPEAAGDSAKFSFTTELLPEYYYAEENFDSYADGTLGSKITTSELFDNTTANVDYTSVVAGAGFNGSNALRAYNPTARATGSIKPVEILEGETIFCEFKLNIHSFEAYRNVTNSETGETSKTGKAGIYISFGGGSYGNSPIQLKSTLISGTTDQFTYSIYGINDWKDYAFANDEWYTVVYKAKLGDKTYGYVYDKNGKLVCYGRSDGNLTNTTPSLSFCGATSDSKGLDILYDDIKVYKITNEKLASKTALGDIYNGATGVTPKSEHIIGFNQPLAINTKSTPNKTANDIFSLYQGDTKIDATFAQLGGNQISIKPAKVLFEETTYTVKFADLPTLSGNALETNEITFTTMDAAYPVGVLDSSLVISDGTVEAGDFTLTMRNRENGLISGDIVVAFYSDNDLSKLVGLKSFRGESFETDREVLTLTLDKDYTDVGRIELIMYDSISTFIPIMSPYVIK